MEFGNKKMENKESLDQSRESVEQAEQVDKDTLEGKLSTEQFDDDGDETSDANNPNDEESTDMKVRDTTAPEAAAGKFSEQVEQPEEVSAQGAKEAENGQELSSKEALATDEVQFDDSDEMDSPKLTEEDDSAEIVEKAEEPFDDTADPDTETADTKVTNSDTNGTSDITEETFDDSVEYKQTESKSGDVAEQDNVGSDSEDSSTKEEETFDDSVEAEPSEDSADAKESNSDSEQVADEVKEEPFDDSKAAEHSTDSLDDAVADKAENPDNSTPVESTTRKSELSNETHENLGSFEQSRWDNLSQAEKEQAVEKLRDSIAEDLQLENKPNIDYYNNEDPGDYGGYAASNNTIYINRYNMGDAAETADTVAHESRHCWQHERADNPQTEQDYQFKENFEDYVRPEDDYRGYRNQPVEADAREYAQNVTDSIPTEHQNGTDENSVELSNSNATGSEIRQRDEGKGAVFDESSELPTDIDKKAGDFESKVKAQEDYSSKFEFDTQKKLEDYYKEDGGNLSSERKEQLVSDLKNSYDNADKSDRGDVLVPESSKDVTNVYYNAKTGKYDVGYDWKPVDTVPESRHMEVLKEGQQFDRVGPPSGRCTGAVGEDGSCATTKERSIPYHFTEDNITKEPSYHRYEAEQDFTKENLSTAIDNSMYSDDKKAEMHTNLDRYYENARKKGYGDGDGLASGEIAPMFEDTTGATGGGKQYDMPFSMEELENIGMISEVSKDRY